MKRLLLTIDGIVNVLLGILLLCFPTGVLHFFGLPPVRHHFYTTILGGVILGIGLALFIELVYGHRHARGLGLAGAIAINLCGGGVLLVWLVCMPFDLPARGMAVLWIVALLVLGIGLVELVSGAWKERS